MIQASPHRLFGGLLISALMCLAAWAYFGQLDIVVTAQGRLVPQNFVRVSQPLEGGAIKEILVHDGQHVVQGQSLLKLDQVNASQDRAALERDNFRLVATLARIEAELSDKAGTTTDAMPEYVLRRMAQQSTVQEAQQGSERASADLSAAQAELARLKDLQGFASRQEGMTRQLQSQGFLSQAAYEDKQKEFVDARNRITSQEKNINALRAAAAQAGTAVERVRAEYRKNLIVEQTQVRAELSKTEAELAKAAHREVVADLVAPVAGIVNNLSVKSVGAVVQQGAVLLTVVPDNEPLMAEVWVRNEDAGLIFPTMLAKVKMAAFPFQKYGWLEGAVQWVGADAETPESMRNTAGEVLFYRARIKLSRQFLERENKRFEAKPGMQVTVDVMLGERTLFEYLTSPIKKTVLEAARER
ncbi:MAG: HlyD family type I secretion periplasmic adaptor subunit [Agitococcus sp.]|nr:HlyD family type I secretion periplasmic adaptor subunit [Agitococcus sp.]